MRLSLFTEKVGGSLRLPLMRWKAAIFSFRIFRHCFGRLVGCLHRSSTLPRCDSLQRPRTIPELTFEFGGHLLPHCRPAPTQSAKSSSTSTAQIRSPWGGVWTLEGGEGAREVVCLVDWKGKVPKLAGKLRGLLLARASLPGLLSQKNQSGEEVDFPFAGLC